jgi:hypothetical protein
MTLPVSFRYFPDHDIPHISLQRAKTGERFNPVLGLFQIYQVFSISYYFIPGKEPVQLIPRLIVPLDIFPTPP